MTSAPQDYSDTTNTRGSEPLKIYTFPEAPHQSNASYSPQAPATPANSNKLHLSIEPLKLPAISNAEVTVLPVPKPSKKAETAQPKQDKNKQAEPDKGFINIAPAKPTQPATPQTADGSALLAHAIELHDQGKTQEAIGAAQQAVDMYQSEVSAGKNSVSARRGAENAKKLIQLWRQ